MNTIPRISIKKITAQNGRLGIYDVLDFPFEHGHHRPIRKHMFSGLAVRILDAGVGTGRNMTFYPEGAKVTGIDLSKAMLLRAEKRRERLQKQFDLLNMDVLETTFPDDHFDAVVTTFLFCVLEPEDQLPALEKLRWITRSGGEIRILEYVYSQNPEKRFMMRLWAPWVRWVYGATFDRNTEQYVSRARLHITDFRFLFQDIIKMLILRHSYYSSCSDSLVEIDLYGGCVRKYCQAPQR